jgi:hypothetical protein
VVSMSSSSVVGWKIVQQAISGLSSNGTGIPCKVSSYPASRENDVMERE